MLNSVRDEIIQSFQNLYDCIVEVWEWISNLIPYFIDMLLSGHSYVSRFGFKLINICKMGPG